MVKRREVVAGLATLPLVSLGTASFMPVHAQEQAQLEGDSIATADGDIIDLRPGPQPLGRAVPATRAAGSP